MIFGDNIIGLIYSYSKLKSDSCEMDGNREPSF